MAEAAKKAKKAPAKKAAAPAKKTEGGYGVEYIAKKTELAEATVRIKLRELGVDKEGKSYWWKTQAEADKIVKQINDLAKED